MYVLLSDVRLARSRHAMAREKPPPEVIVFHEPAPSRPPRWKGKEEVRETGAGVALSKVREARDELAWPGTGNTWHTSDPAHSLP